MRESVERENSDKDAALRSEIAKKHREERAKGKLYVEALQRDQEILFMHRMRSAGLLW